MYFACKFDLFVLFEVKVHIIFRFKNQSGVFMSFEEHLKLIVREVKWTLRNVLKYGIKFFPLWVETKSRKVHKINLLMKLQRT